MSGGRAAIAAAALFGVAVRAAPVVGADFPLGDGGLFHEMTERLRANGYGLPGTVTYGEHEIPFTYPPLGFYVAAAFADVTGATVLDTMRILPLAESVLGLVVFVHLARAVLADDRRVFGAVLAFGALPLAYLHFVLAAGIARGLGYLFAIACALFTYRALRDGMTRDTLLAGIAGALTILSHPNATIFAAATGAVFVAMFVRDRSRAARAALIAALALAGSAPWWVPVLARHGPAPFVAAAQSGDPALPGWTLLTTLRWTGEPLLPVLGMVSAAGAVLAALGGELVLPLWLAASCAADSRYKCSFASVPVALLAGVALAPLIARAQHSAPAVAGRAERLLAGVARVALSAIVVWALASPFMFRDTALYPLPAGLRTAMRWVAENTPHDARFAVVAVAGDAVSGESEWFPVLARRVSVATYQGTEWLAPTSPTRWDLYVLLQTCGLSADPACLDHWSVVSGQRFTHVFVRAERTEAFRAALHASPDYRPLYEDPNAAVFERVR